MIFSRSVSASCSVWRAISVALIVVLGASGLSGCGSSAFPDTSTNEVAPKQAPLILATQTAVTDVVPGQSLTLRGSGFIGDMGVKLGNINLSVTVVSPTEMTVTLPVALPINSFTLVLTRFNDGAVQSYLIKVVSAALTVSGISPALPLVGGTVTLTGTGFVGALNLSINNRALTYTINSSTEVVVNLPSDLGAGSYSLLVAKADGQTASVPVTIVAPLVVTPSSSSPTIGEVLHILGSGFDSTTTATWGGAGLAVTFISSTELTVVVPRNATNGENTVVITRGQDRRSQNLLVTLALPALVLSSVSPNALVAPGASVSVTGAGFIGNMEVTVGGLSATPTVTSATQMSVVLPPSVSFGTQPLIIKRTNDNVSQSTTITVSVPALSVSNTSPISTSIGATLSLHGTGFDVRGMRVDVQQGGVTTAASSFTVTSSTDLTVVLPSSVLAGAASLVLTRTIDNARVSVNLTIVSAFSLGAQVAIPAPGGTLVLAGTGFSADTRATMDGVAVTVSAWTSTQLSLAVPGNWRNAISLVAVSRVSDTSSTSQSYWINVPLTLSAITTPLYRGQQVSIKGTGFVTQGNGNLFLAGVTQTYTKQSTEELLWTVPADHAVGNNISLRFDRGDRQSTNINVSVAAIPSASVSPSSASTGDILTFTGSNLTSIRSVKFGPASVLITPTSDATFSMVLPSNAASGDIVFVDSAGTSFVCCQLQLATAGVVKIAQVQAVQTHLIDMDLNDTNSVPQRKIQISPHRDVLIRAKVIKQNTSAAVTPSVQIQITNSAGSSQWFDMTGPALLSSTVPADTQSGLLNDSFTYRVPKNLISSDGSFSVLIKAQSSDGTNTVQYFKQPAVMPQAYMYLHLLPITVSGKSPAAPTIDLARIQTALEGYFPLEIETRIEPTLDAGTFAGLGGEPTTALLAKVKTAHEVSGLSKTCHFYMGVIGFPLSNVAYLTGRESLVSNLWEIGYPANGVSTNYLAVSSPIPHELGHNFGRIHSWEDNSNPNKTDSLLGSYVNVNLGIKKYNEDNGITPSVIQDTYEDHWFFPTSLFDLMSYGSTNETPGYGYKGMSYYTYKGFQDYAVNNLRYSNKVDCTSTSAALVKPAANTGGKVNTVSNGNGSPGLLIQGSLKVDSHTAEIFAPTPLTSTAQVREIDSLPQYWQSRASLSSNPAVVLRVTRNNDTVHYFPLKLEAIDHSSALHFAVVIPPQGTIKKIEVLDASQTVWTAPTKTLLSKLQSLASVFDTGSLLNSSPQAFTWAWSGNILTVKFDNARYQALRVLYTSNGKTTLVADLGNRSGTVTIDFSAQAAHGTVNLELSDGLNTESRSFER